MTHLPPPSSHPCPNPPAKQTPPASAGKAGWFAFWGRARLLAVLCLLPGLVALACTSQAALYSNIRGVGTQIATPGTTPTRTPPTASAPTAPNETLPQVPPTTPQPLPTLGAGAIAAGSYAVGSQLAPGIYMGFGGYADGQACDWAVTARGKQRAGRSSAGRFYIELRPSDEAFTASCAFQPLDRAAPRHAHPPLLLDPGQYLVMVDMLPGFYIGDASQQPSGTCSWALLSDLSGERSSIILSGNPTGRFYIHVTSAERSLRSSCPLHLYIPPEPAPTLQQGITRGGAAG